MMIWTMLVSVALTAILPGTYTNEEQVYFAAEAGRQPPRWTAVRIDTVADGHRLQPIDAFGRSTGASWLLPDACLRAEADGFVSTGASGCEAPQVIAVRPAGITLKGADGDELLLDRARAFTCWAAIRKRAPKAGGGEDWYFTRGLALHDAGGRVLVTSNEDEPQSVTLRMRDVAWSSGPNRPSLVLYVHTDDPARAISYSWADPGASRIGINLRWMQASCTLADDQAVEGAPG